jgi:hypothetical protein
MKSIFAFVLALASISVFANTNGARQTLNGLVGTSLVGVNPESGEACRITIQRRGAGIRISTLGASATIPDSLRRNSPRHRLTIENGEQWSDASLVYVNAVTAKSAIIGMGGNGEVASVHLTIGERDYLCEATN